MGDLMQHGLDDMRERAERAEAGADSLAAENERLTALLKQTSDENNIFRASAANGLGACVYCKLSREDWAKCETGFPGCARGDDASLCPHVGSAMDADAKVAAISTMIDQLSLLAARMLVAARAG